MPTSGLVSCMRNEAPFLLEWVAYHSMLGFDRIFVYTNACTDGTDMMLERLQQMGVLTHMHNPMSEGLGPQESAMQHFSCRWTMCRSLTGFCILTRTSF